MSPNDRYVLAISMVVGGVVAAFWPRRRRSLWRLGRQQDKLAGDDPARLSNLGWLRELNSFIYRQNLQMVIGALIGLGVGGVVLARSASIVILALLAIGLFLVKRRRQKATRSSDLPRTNPSVDGPR